MTTHKVKSIDTLEALPYEEPEEVQVKAVEDLVEEFEEISTENGHEPEVITEPEPEKPKVSIKKPELITPVPDIVAEEVEFEIELPPNGSPAGSTKEDVVSKKPKEKGPIKPSEDDDEGQLGLF